ncbi:glycosyltransferase family 90 protein [Ramaria rubella]|nr:glycosyltransferase family 90 protein [Ramaria rubella]
MARGVDKTSLCAVFRLSFFFAVILAVITSVLVLSCLDNDREASSFRIQPRAIWDEATSQPSEEGERLDPRALAHSPKHEYLSSGLLKTNMRGNHPMLQLIEHAKTRWDDLQRRQSKTLEQARIEYKRRYKRSPPRGFDDWYAFALDHDFVLIDEFDQIDRDIAPLLALPRSTLRERLEEAREACEKSGFIIDIRPSHEVTFHGPAFTQKRAKLIQSLALSVSRGLPNLTIYGSGEDRSGRILGDEMRQWMSEGKGGRTEFPHPTLQRFENPFRDGRQDIFSACQSPPPKSFMTAFTNSLQDQTATAHSPTFIYDPSPASDLCLHPSLVHLHGSLSAAPVARGPRLFPEFVFGKMPFGSEILLPDTAGFDSFTLKNSRQWAEKTHNKLFWRGFSTGASHSQHSGGPLGWKGGSQRMRAAFTFANGSESTFPAFLPREVPVLTLSSKGGLEINSYLRTTLNDIYADVGLVKPAIQCNKDDGTCETMRKEVPWREDRGVWGVERSRWKYLLDLDSNGHSADFVTSLGLGSVVLKSTIFPHWNSDWLIPYYHYIPIQQDYSDVYNVMAFFAGPPAKGSKGFHIDTAGGHDNLAQQIGENAAKFVRTMWRWEDMQVYMYRLLLEYARLVREDEEETMDNSPIDLVYDD